MDRLILDPRQHVFDTILGQEKAKKLLRSMVARNRLPKALLLHGRPGVGKKSLAYALAKYVNSCPEGDRPDRLTGACRKIARGTYLDLIELTPGGPGGQIRVESAHEAEARLATSPIEARKKVLLILDAHRMNIATANALLKTIEEPPRHALIVVVTDRPRMLPATIRSRCSPIRCSEVDSDTLATWLVENIEQLQGDRNLGRFVALLAEGRPGRALAMVKEGLMHQRSEAIEALSNFHRDGYRAFMITAYRLGQGRDGLANALTLLFTWYRDLLVSRAAPGEDALLINRDHAAAIERLAAGTGIERLVAALDRVARRFDLADRIANTQLVLESLLIEVGVALKA